MEKAHLTHELRPRTALASLSGCLGCRRCCANIGIKHTCKVRVPAVNFEWLNNSPGLVQNALPKKASASAPCSGRFLQNQTLEVAFKQSSRSRSARTEHARNGITVESGALDLLLSPSPSPDASVRALLSEGCVRHQGSGTSTAKWRNA